MIIEYKDKHPKIDKNVFIAPTATVIGDVEITEGANIWYGTVLRGDTSFIRIGRNTNIQDNSTVHTDGNNPVIIGDDVTIGHNAVIHGCTIENRSLIGIGAVVLSAALIKTGSIVAAGSVVKEGQIVGPNNLVAGTPASFKKILSETDDAVFDRPVKNYLKLAHEHNTVIQRK
jgi:carbonic anhydrase/acetyltransferase-like protein (isoleucine patch superfamily)